MEPVTAIAVIAAKYGVRRLVSALGGEDDLGTVAAELLGALSATESRLDERLAGIERRLDEVLEQPYATAVRAGLRVLVDAVPTAQPEQRREDLLRALNSFTQAVAAARTPLQIGLAERYLVLCNLALGRSESARSAVEHLNKAATEAALETADTILRSEHNAAERIRSGGPRRRLFADVKEEQTHIVKAAYDAAALIENLLREADVLGQSLGLAAQSQIRKWPLTLDPLGPPAGVGLWSLGVEIPGEAHVGALHLRWEDLSDTGETAPLPVISTWDRLNTPGLERLGNVLRIKAVLNARPVLTRNVEIQVRGIGPTTLRPVTQGLSSNSPMSFPASGEWMLGAGEDLIRINCRFALHSPDVIREDLRKARTEGSHLFRGEAIDLVIGATFACSPRLIVG